MSAEGVKTELNAARSAAEEAKAATGLAQLQIEEAAAPLRAAHTHLHRLRSSLQLGRSRLSNATASAQQGSSSVESAVWGAASCLDGAANQHAITTQEQFWSGLLEVQNALGQLAVCSGVVDELLLKVEALQNKLDEALPPLVSEPDGAQACALEASTRMSQGIEEAATYSGYL